MTTQLAMVIDSSLCIDCKACMVACKVENHVPEGFWRNWIKEQMPPVETLLSKTGSVKLHFQPGNCMHCNNATCVAACPTGATYKDTQEGTVKVNEKLCIGCGSCIPACPYGARYRHPEKKVVDKCDFCEARRNRNELPACVVTCPTKARTFGNIKDPTDPVSTQLAKQTTVRVVNADTDTKPNIYYLSETAPLNWPRKAKEPSPIRWLKTLYPIIWGAVGINALMVMLMLGKQLFTQNDHTPPDKDQNQDTKGGQHA